MTYQNTPARRTLQGYLDRPIPEGVNIEQGQMRTNFEHRERVKDWLTECNGNKALSDQEYAMRVKAADKAVTEDDLRLIVSDLPPLPLLRAEERQREAEKRKAWLKRTWGNAGGRLTLMTSGIAASLALLISSVTMVSRKGPAPIWPVPLIAIGAIGFIAFIAWTIVTTDKVKWDNDHLRWKNRD